MIYLQNNSEAQEVCVPRNGIVADEELVFKAKNTIDLAVEIDLYVADLRVSNLYYYLAVVLPDGIPNGEYEYTLISGETLLSTGLLVVGENSQPSEYNKVIQYEQYETGN